MHTYPDTVIHPSTNYPSHPWVSWAAVIAGTASAIAVQIALTALCVAIGLAVFEPVDPESSITSIAVGTAAAMMICALISVFVGAWVTGRMKYHHTSCEAAIHGMLVWAVSATSTLLLTSISIGILAGGAFSLLGQGVAGASKGLAAAVPTAVELVAPSWDDIKELLKSSISSGDQASDTPAAQNRFTNQSRLLQLLTQSFNMDNTAIPQADQAELHGLLATQLGISPEAARSTMEQWQRVWQQGVSTYESAKDAVETKAEQAADLAAKRTSQAAIIVFFALLVGLGAAIGGALLGSAGSAKCCRIETVALPANRLP